MARFSFLLLATALVAQKAMAIPRRVSPSCPQIRFIANPQPPTSGCPDEDDMWKCDNLYCGGEISDKPGWCKNILTVACDGYYDVKKDQEDTVFNDRRCPCKSEKAPNGGTDDDSGGGIIIIPFPIAPPGFLVPPAGVGNPKNKDSCPEDYTETKCKDCKAKSGWCTEGPQMGCPCLDECPTGKDLPVCSDDDCLGGEDDKCSVGYHKDCACKNECPDDDTVIPCDDEICKGKDEKCTVEKFHDCQCVYSADTIGMYGNLGWVYTKQQYIKEALEAVENADKPNLGTRADCSPQDKNHSTIVRKNLVEAARGYCFGIDGDLKRTIDDHKGPYFSNDNKGQDKFSIGIDFSEKQGGCKEAKTYEPSFDDCLSKLTSIVDECQTDSGDKTGGSRIWSTDQGCIEYRIIVYSGEYTP